MPNHRKVASYPREAIMLAMGMMVSADPAPNPAAVKPAASPRRSANHLSALPTQVPYTAPAPMPEIAPPKYSMGRVDAWELMSQAMATSTPPTATTIRGPNLSTIQPSIGTSHVSIATKMLN